MNLSRAQSTFVSTLKFVCQCRCEPGCLLQEKKAPLICVVLSRVSCVGATVGVDVNASISLPRVWSNFEQQGLHPPVAYFFGDVATHDVQVRRE